MSNDADTGARIAEARRKKGLSQRALATAVSLSHVFVRQVEKGTTPLPRGRALAFSRVLDIPVADLVELDPATLAVVEQRLRAAGRCDRAVRLVQEMAGGGA